MNVFLPLLLAAVPAFYILRQRNRRSSSPLPPSEEFPSSVRRWAEFSRQPGLDAVKIFNENQMKTLQAIVNSIIPSIPEKEIPQETRDILRARLTDKEIAEYFRVNATEQKIDKEICLTLKHFTSVPLAGLRFMLSLMDNRWFNLIVHGRFCSFANLESSLQQEILLRWRASRFSAFRATANTFINATHYMALVCLNEKSENIYWKALGYPGPEKEFRDHEEYKFQTLQVTADQSLEYDYIVIGSGCGGSVAAAELSSAGFSVLVIEKGHYVQDREFDNLEYRANKILFDSHFTEDGAISIGAGSTLGGGSVINWAASIKLPEEIRIEWSKEFGVSLVAPGSEEYSEAENYVWSKNSTQFNSANNKPNEKLILGCNNCNYPVEPVARNCIDNTLESGFTAFGDRHGNKQSTLKTWLKDAALYGAEILTNCHVDRILMGNGRATGVSGHCMNKKDFSIHRVLVKAKHGVIASAGSLQTPALLKRSGLENENIGKFLHLHPATIVAGKFPEAINSWQGDLLTAVSEEKENLDGRHHGIRYEVPTVHPGSFANIAHYENPIQWKSELATYPQQSFILVLSRDFNESGQVLSTPRGPVCRYSLQERECQHILQGVIGAIRILEAAGAIEINSTYPGVEKLKLGQLNAEARKAKTQEYIESLEAKYKSEKLWKPSLYSAHQMGTCRMGQTPASSATDENGLVWGTSNLFVCDGSLFPAASGVNPMVTILALARCVAKRIIKNHRH